MASKPRTDIIYEVATIADKAAEDAVRERVADQPTQMLYHSGALMWAMLQREIDRGTSKEALVAFISRMYDVLNSEQPQPPRAAQC